MQELTFVRVKKDGKATRCPDCGDIVLECTENRIMAIDTDFLEHIQRTCDPEDPMHEYYKGIDPESLPQEHCPDCQIDVVLSEVDAILEEDIY